MKKNTTMTLEQRAARIQRRADRLTRLSAIVGGASIIYIAHGVKNGKLADDPALLKAGQITCIAALTGGATAVTSLISEATIKAKCKKAAKKIAKEMVDDIVDLDLDEEDDEEEDPVEREDDPLHAAAEEMAGEPAPEG